jgi:hypothetical protein
MKVLLTLSLFLSAITPLFSQSKDSVLPHKVVLPWFVERFKISAGAFYVVNKTNIRLELHDASGTDINMEKDLGINKEIATFLANFQWQISRRSRISLNYYNINRNSTHTLQKDIIVEDNVYPVNSTVSSFFNTTIYQFSYGYAILSKPTYEAGLMIGTHILHSNTGISLDGGNAGLETQNDFGFTAPLPDLGFWGGWSMGKRFAMNADISYFALTMNNKSGRLLAFNLNLTYKLIDQLDLTLGYTGLDFKVDVIRPDVTGNFKWGYNGPALTVNFSFGKKSWTH